MALKRIKEHMLDSDFTTKVNNHTETLNDHATELAQITTLGVFLESFKIQSPEVDDTGRIQRAIDSLTTGTVFFSKDITYTMGTVNLKSNVSLDLNGSKINNGKFVGNVENVTIKNGFFENASAEAIELTDGQNNRIESILFNNCYDGIHLHGTNNHLENIQVDKCIFLNTKNSTVKLYRIRKSTFDKLSIFNSRWGFNITTYTEDIIISNSFFTLGASATTPTGDDTHFAGQPEHGIYMHNFNDIQVVNCTFTGWSRAGGSCGAKIRNGRKATLTDCKFLDNYLSIGMYIQDTSTLYVLENIKINNCIFENATALLGDTSPTTRIYIRDARTTPDTVQMDVKLSNCHFRTYANINNSDGYGELKLDDCDFNDTAYVYDSSSNRDIVIDDCYFDKGDGAALFLSGVLTKGVVNNCKFKDWALDTTTWTGNDLEIQKGAIALKNCKNVTIKGSKFIQQTKRAIGGYGTSSGSLTENRIVYNEGGKDMWAYQSGGTATNYVGFNTTYNGQLANTTDLKSIGNNVRINTVDNTVVVY